MGKDVSEHEEQMRDLFGPAPTYSEHKAGEQIRFSQDGYVKSGVIIAVRAPAVAVVGGNVHPTVYVVNCGEGFPSIAYAGDIIEEE
jgi:hypothetical protein